MTGWLIYSEEGVARNGTFIRFFEDAARKRGVCLKLKRPNEIFNDSLPDFAIVRLMDPGLSFRLESMGVPVFNKAVVSEVCNDKWKTYALASKLGVPFPKTVYVPDPSEFVPTEYPFVLKSCTGHGGTQVFMVRNASELSEAKSVLSGIPSVAQNVVTDVGKDVRVYVLGNEILCAMLRENPNDFKSNFCLGGSARVYTLSEEEISMVKRFTDALPFGLAGVDFIFDHGKAVFNEIEDVVGCRMLYSLTDLAPVELYMDFILKQL